MQLETIRKQINGVVRFVVLKDGVHVADFGAASLALQYQDQHARRESMWTVEVAVWEPRYNGHDWAEYTQVFKTKQEAVRYARFTRERGRTECCVRPFVAGDRNLG